MVQDLVLSLEAGLSHQNAGNRFQLSSRIKVPGFSLPSECWKEVPVAQQTAANKFQ
jgi:hypothetical protein